MGKDLLTYSTDAFGVLKVVKALLPLSNRGDYIVIMLNGSYGAYTIQSSELTKSLDDANLEEDETLQRVAEELKSGKLERVTIEVLRYK